MRPDHDGLQKPSGTAPALEAEPQELVALRPGVYGARDNEGRMHLVSGHGSEPLGPSTPALRRTLRHLADQPRPAKTFDGLRDLVGRLRAAGWLSITVMRHGHPLYTLIPELRAPALPPAPPARPLFLSRFALLRRADDQLVLESPTAWCRIAIHDPSILPALPGASERADDPTVLPVQKLVTRLHHDLWWAGLATAGGEEEEELSQCQWSPHELWFHERSRVLRNGAGRGYGGTWWAHRTFTAPPAVREPHEGPTVGLYQPDIALLTETDPTVTEVIETRRSIRQHDHAAPLDIRQLGEFLYRCCRNRSRTNYDSMELLGRPYPGGGAVYELEIYPAVARVAGAAPGLYHYRPDSHELTLVRGPDRTFERLVRVASTSTTLDGPPQVVLVIAARFGRVMWKYESMAYSLTLKNVGVLYHLMYMVATAMGLAPCALGGGGSDVFAAATGIDPLVEGSVGEFILGSRPLPRTSEDSNDG